MKNSGFRISRPVYTLLISLGMLVSMNSYGQQEPLYTQYMFNTQTINPAYAGSWDNLGFLVLGRRQWVGMPGAPSTFTFSVQSPVRNQKIGIGLNVISDQIGLIKRNSFFGDYSYRLRVTEDSYLRLGLKFGFTNFSHNLTGHVQYPGDPNDHMFMSDIEQRFLPNFGVGAFFYGENFYMGLSVPKLVESDLIDNYNAYTSAEFRHFFLTAGYVFDMNSFLKFKPTFLAKAVINAPVEFDLTANFLLKDKFWLGAMYRTGDAFGFLAQWVFDKQLRIGYAMDFTTTQLQRHHSGTHEVMISYEIGSYRRKWNSPRMF